tara:strand:- start:325 stop:1233 length:909 start_codon:yes stop_codon:yes gene_type:complete
MAKARTRLPEWFRTRLPTGELQKKFNETKNTVTENMLHTVCQEARCPNIHECWAAKDATFMVAGQECTRGCRFCAVGTIKRPPPLDEKEPASLAEAISNMGLNHAVITVVNRDDLPDSGAAHYRKCLEAVRESSPEVTLELLCSDLAGDYLALNSLLDGLELEVFAHNVECVPRLDSTVRDARASFDQSIGILLEAKRLRPDILTKSSIMVGLGETDDEILEALQLLRDANVDLVTIGQYLAPSPNHLPVDRFPEPSRFDEWSSHIEDIGFLGWACGPLVRSSYRAGDLLAKASARLRTDKE